MQIPETKRDICLQFWIFPQKDHTPPVSHAGYYGRILLLGRRNALGTFVMEGDAGGGGETPLFVGG